jgi:hypothetical protein
VDAGRVGHLLEFCEYAGSAVDEYVLSLYVVDEVPGCRVVWAADAARTS